MKTTKAKPIVRLAIGLAAIMLVWSPWSARRKAAADAPTTRVQVFGAIGITMGQTAQVNVLTPPPVGDRPGPLPPPIGDRTTSVEMFLVADDGSVVQQKMADLAPGRSATLSLNGDDFVRSGRIQLHAIVRFLPPPTGDQPPPVNDRCGAGGLVSTVEVIDNATSRTSFVLIPPPTGD